MKREKRARIVLVTCGSPAEGRKIARGVVGKRLAACVNVALSPVESCYTWKGKQEVAREYFLVIKTTAARLQELEKEVKRLHRYDVPEFIALPIVEGSQRYLAWLHESVAKPSRKSR